MRQYKQRPRTTTKGVGDIVEVIVVMIKAGFVVLGFLKIRKKGSKYDKILAYIFVVVCMGFAIGG